MFSGCSLKNKCSLKPELDLTLTHDLPCIKWRQLVVSTCLFYPDEIERILKQAAQNFTDLMRTRAAQIVVTTMITRSDNSDNNGSMQL